MAQRRAAPPAQQQRPAARQAPAAAANTSIEKAKPRHQIVRERIERVTPYIGQLLPERLGITAERFARVTINCIESDETGKLLQCSDGSLIRAILHAAEVGLEPGGAYGHCYILPYWNRKANDGRGGYEAQFMIGVWGYVELARRNPRIKNVWADCIFANDFYKVTSGSGGKQIIHEPRWDLPFADRGEIIGAYACAQLDDGTVSSELMNLEELERARATSQAPNSPAWTNWQPEMYKRTAIKRAQKYWPKGADLSLRRAIELEEHPDRASGPVREALAQVMPTPQRGRGAVLDAMVNAAKATRGSDDDDGGSEPELTPEVVLEALAAADEAWRGDDRLGVVNNWSPAQMRLAHDWAQAFVHAEADEDIPERPPFTVAERQPGEDG
jgi:recombination protein RecT